MKYAKYLSQVLTDRLRHLQAAYYGAITLRDELAVLQNFMAEDLERYDRARVAQTAATDNKEKIAFAAAASLAREAVVDITMKVMQVATAAARIEADEKMVGIGMVHGMMAQMCEIVDDEVAAFAPQGDAKAIAFRIAERARTELIKINDVVEMSANDRTRLLPADEEAAAMDSTVPYVIEGNVA